MQNLIRSMDFDAIRLRLASPEVIKGWSHGEILRPETINYRTQKPEKDGLFCEKIFGPSKDWECYCGKYKKIRYKGIVCDKCGVEVTRTIVRRERMGHIDLASPVTHIWFLRSVPSRIGTLLGVAPQSLEKVIYFANFIIISVQHDLKIGILEELKEEFKNKKKKINKEYQARSKEVKESDNKKVEKELVALAKEKEEEMSELEENFSASEKDLKDLKELKIISEAEYQDLSLKYGHIFEAGIGAEAIRKLLEKIDPEKEIEIVSKEIKNYKGIKKEKAVKRLKLLRNLKHNEVRPEWTVMTVIPVIPPDLRPMVALDGGRFATSDLNDLYRRVINRNNRLKQLKKLNAPEVISRNEKRMLQEAVDALIDNNARHGKTVVSSTGQKRMLKSISDILKGKQGRFRQNLLGKRVDYSGRSVIVIGPHLKINECGLPKKMALELFKPFVISKLIRDEVIHNVRSAIRFINEGRVEVWDILEEVIADAYVLLNRAPTLHRLGIQAFKPILIEGKAIQIHPMVCSAFNADFDGDQMAVHVPLTKEAQKEAKELMQSSKNLLKPATGDPVVSPSQDIVWGCYYLTSSSQEKVDDKKIKVFANENQAILAYDLKNIKLKNFIKVRIGKKIVTTTIGRVLFNKILPRDMEYLNEKMDAGSLKGLVKSILSNYGLERAGQFVDDLKRTGFKYLTISGLSWGMGDLPFIDERQGILEVTEKQVQEIKQQYDAGLLTDAERHSKIIETWTFAKEKIVALAKESLDTKGSVFSIIDSKAKGHWGQLTQVIGMKGLVSSPSGDIIELPAKGNFKEGFDVLEFFISTHGSRKGLSDTALRTANAGYLTRRLVDVVQDMFVQEEDCKTREGIQLTKENSERLSSNLADRVLGRVSFEEVKDPKTKEIVLKKGQIITEAERDKLKELDLENLKIRSVLTCKSQKGVCQKCYGWDLGYNKLVKKGATVGVVAAQSIGEPGTQLTMRTFHTGGVAGDDITQGLPRVEELFEARNPKRRAVLAEEDGVVKIAQLERTIKDATGKIVLENVPGQKVLKLEYIGEDEDKYDFRTATKKKIDDSKKEGELEIKVKEGDKVEKGDLLFIRSNGTKVKAKEFGEARVLSTKVAVFRTVNKIKEFSVAKGFDIWVKNGEKVQKGQQLTEGSLNLQQLHTLAGRTKTQRYIINEIQYLYSSQGQPLNDKHVEVIARQMFSKVNITSDGDTNFLPGTVIDRRDFEDENKKMEKAGKTKAKGEELLLGITKNSLSTKSFLSAASFQETSKILIEASLSGKIDPLDGLKENVIIGRLIPAGTGFKKK
ncbi:DNA-directed RNA polymerase subunit beta' [Candidatus Falkowbacteria bacterium]|jgi:DNA-directed RNA polymerase subunit beta'|nr:DNA-directed RNA polymerase subunit beta' [Candidatus Falkowbacteria bacterium]MBT4432800.1 DNA-directed RNA polymerase subunit beta' [Candidatus Falkowbacteria bacterium]